MIAIIIDDENESREGLLGLIPWETLGIGIVLTATDGFEGLAMIREHRPDIVFTDIMMPRMSGLELLKRINEEPQPPKTIIISGHDDFYFARDALRLGAYNYILKPFQSGELLPIVQSCLDDIQFSRVAILQNVQEKDIHMEAIAKLQEKLAIDLLFNNFFDPERMLHKLKLVGLAWMANRELTAMIVEIDDLSSIAFEQDPLGSKSLLHFTMGNVLRDTFASDGSCPFFLMPLDAERWAAVMAWTSREELRALALRACENVKQFGKLGITIGIGLRQPAAALSLSYRSAAQCMGFKSVIGGSPVLFSDEIGIRDYASLPDSSATEQELFALIRQGIVHKETRARLTKLIREWNVTHRDTLQHRLFEWLMKVERLLKNDVSHLEVILDNPIRSWSEFVKYDTFNGILGYTMTIVEQLAHAMNGKQNGHMGLIVTRAVDYMRLHYSTELTLQTVADHVYVSPVWLSHLLKDKTDKTFLTLLTEIRMEKAKELLAAPERKGYEIPELVGYKNVDYFYKLFRKHTGMTPKQYRDSL